MKKHIPNMVTLANLLSGCLALYCIYSHRLEEAAWLILAALFFDLMDGLVARALRVASPLGVQLDSLSDMVSFGVVPAAFAATLLEGDWRLAALLIPLTAALRLGRFNIDSRQHTTFSGMPTPAAALFFVSLILCRKWDLSLFQAVWSHPWVMITSTVIIAFLMVIPLPMFSLKIKEWSWRNTWPLYLTVLLSAVALLLWGWGAVSLIVPIYVAVCVVNLRF